MTDGKPSPPSLEAQITAIAQTVVGLSSEVEKNHDDKTRDQLLLRLRAILAALKQWNGADPIVKYATEKKALDEKLKDLRKQEDQAGVAEKIAEAEAELDQLKKLDRLKRLAAASETNANQFVKQLGGDIKPPAAVTTEKSISNVDDLLSKLTADRKRD